MYKMIRPIVTRLRNSFLHVMSQRNRKYSQGSPNLLLNHNHPLTPREGYYHPLIREGSSPRAIAQTNKARQAHAGVAASQVPKLALHSLERVGRREQLRRLVFCAARPVWHCSKFTTRAPLSTAHLSSGGYDSIETCCSRPMSAVRWSLRRATPGTRGRTLRRAHARCP